MTRLLEQEPNKTGHPDSSLKLFMIENHNQALSIWRDYGLRRKRLVHIDAHIDFYWIAEQGPLEALRAGGVNELESLFKKDRLWNVSGLKKEALTNIGNYIYPAIKEGIVREFYWVVPDQIWDDKRQRAALKRIFLRLRRVNPDEAGEFKEYPRKIEGSLRGVKTTVLKLSHLPEISEGALLDIDTDYMIINSLTEGAPYFKKKPSCPWIWPGDLAKAIHKGLARPELITIAYSVEGGFTPLEYKYLGDELKNILNKGSGTALAAALRESARLRARGLSAQAISRIKAELPEDESSKSCRGYAPLYYNLFALLKEGNQLEEAGGYLKKALSLDNSYATNYNNSSLKLMAERKFSLARKESRFMAGLFPENTDYILSLGDALLSLGRPKAALKSYLEVIRKQPDNVRARTRAGYIYFRDRQYALAREFLNQAAALDSANGLAAYWLGRVYARMAALNPAIKHLQRGIALGVRGPGVFLHLAWLYFKAGNFFKAREKLFKFIPAVFKKLFSH